MSSFLKSTFKSNDFNNIFEFNLINGSLLIAYVILLMFVVIGSAYIPLPVSIISVGLLLSLMLFSFSSLHTNRKSLTYMNDYTKSFGTTTEKVDHHVSSLCFAMLDFSVFKTVSGRYIIVDNSTMHSDGCYKVVNLNPRNPHKIGMAVFN